MTLHQHRIASVTVVVAALSVLAGCNQVHSRRSSSDALISPPHAIRLPVMAAGENVRTSTKHEAMQIWKPAAEAEAEVGTNLSRDL